MKKKCLYNSRLSAYLDGELSQEEKGKLYSHLKTCDECQEELRCIQNIGALINNLEEVEPSPGFSQSFWKKVAQIEAKKQKGSLIRLFFSGWRPYAATAAVVVILLSLMLYQQQPAFKAEEILIAEQLELFEDFEVINQLDLLENWDVIETLDEKPS